MDEYTYNRWKRFGNDRLYIARADGTKLGYVDLTNGMGVPAPGSDREHLELLAQAWRAREGVAPSPVHREPDTGGTPVDVPPAEPARPYLGQDLGFNRAGDAARAKATEEWDAYHARRPIASRIAKFLDLDTPDKSWARGAAGEVEVGRRLEKLVPYGWRVLHAVPIGKNGADIDHLFIGPAGVFCINTKNHSRSNVWISSKVIMVNGQKTDHLRNSRFEGRRVSAILTQATGWRIEAQPMLAIMARDVTVRSKPEDVFVVARRDLPGWFNRRPAIYSAEAVERIYLIARRGATWEAK